MLAEIDPLNAAHFAGVPWVYPSLQAARKARDRLGPAAMHRQALDVIGRHGTLGGNVARAIAITTWRRCR